jgi:hypothetical protein
MPQFLKKLTIIIVAAFGVSGLFSRAEAYVLQGPHILKLMIETLGDAKRLRVSQRLVIHDRSPTHNPAEIRETVKYLYPDAFRSDISSDTTQRIYLFTGGKVLTIVDGKASAGAETWFDRYKDLFLYHSRVLLTNQLMLSGVDTSVSSMGRFGDKIAYVVGGEYPAENRSQVWIEKDTFRPIRWILRDIPNYPDIGTVEFRYKNWQKFDNAAYPMEIEFFQDGLLVRKLNVETVTVNPEFSKDLFDMETLQSRYLPVEREEKAPEALDEVRKTIEEFKRRFE